MIVRFYTVLDDNRVVSKNLGSVDLQCNAMVYDNCSIMHPSLLLEYDGVFVNANYFEVPSWNRFYYLKDVVAMPGGRCVVTGDEDVLKSNESSILTLSAYVIRSQTMRTPLFYDNKYQAKSNRKCTTLSFNHVVFNSSPSIGTPCYVLQVLGGSDNQT